MKADAVVQGMIPDQNSSRDIVFAVGILVILALLFLPLPTVLIDFGLAVSIAFSVLILMVVASITYSAWLELRSRNQGATA